MGWRDYSTCFLAVLLEIPSCLAMFLRETPCSRAWWTAFGSVWPVEAVQVGVTESCSAEAWMLVGLAGGLAPVAAAVAVTSWLWA